MSNNSDWTLASDRLPSESEWRDINGDPAVFLIEDEAGHQLEAYFDGCDFFDKISVEVATAFRWKAVPSKLNRYYEATDDDLRYIIGDGNSIDRMTSDLLCGFSVAGQIGDIVGIPKDIRDVVGLLNRLSEVAQKRKIV